MSVVRLVVAGLWHHRSVHVAVALGVCVATAVLTGALLVGESVRGSLRELTIERLGLIDQAVLAARPFRAQLAEELVSQPDFNTHFTAAQPVLLTRGTLTADRGSQKRRATNVAVIGVPPEFGELGWGLPELTPEENGVYLTRPLADELRVEPGDEVLIRLGTTTAIPADSLLGDKEDTSVSRRFPVAAVLEPRGLARFDLQPSQHPPRNVFVRLGDLQRLLELPGKANTLLVAGHEVDRPAGLSATQDLARAVRPRLDDIGIHVAADPGHGYVQISADALVLPDAVVRAAERAFADTSWQPVVTYLANTLRHGERQVPYSTISGVDSTAELGPLRDPDGRAIRLQDDEIVLNRWAADELAAAPGDEVVVSYYEPESTHGRLVERQLLPKRVRAIAEMTSAGGGLALAADPQLTPRLAGVTDQRAISDWDLPFELVEEIRRQDEEYWDEYSTAPKAFVSLTTAEQAWSSRWGTISIIRVPISSGLSVDDVSARLVRELDVSALGFQILPVKRQGLDAASGTTPFEGLFVGFSFFLIAAALLLIALLFQLGVSQRAAEVGILAALGIRRRQIAQVFAGEGLVVALCGAALGVLFGIGYAGLMIWALKTVWLDAIATPFVALHVTWRGLLLGGALGLAASYAAIRMALRRIVRLPVRRLLAGASHLETPTARHSQQRGRRWIVAVLLLLAVGLAAAGIGWQAEAQAGAFFGSGAILLVALLVLLRGQLARQASMRRSGARLSLLGLSVRNAARNSGRSTLTIGLVAIASYLIMAISAFRLAPADSGTGGFALYATSDLPVHVDLNTSAGQRELGLTRAQSELLDEWRFVSCRVHDGQEASCLSLYKPTQPRVLGVPPLLAEISAFDWSAHADTLPDEAVVDAHADQWWQLLEADLGTDADGQPLIPVVLDANTAMYSLHLSGVGAPLPIRDAQDRTVQLQVVGLLKNSMLQGDVLMSETNFLRLFPNTSGPRQFLIQRPSTGSSSTDSRASQNVEMAGLLESALDDYGLDVVDARARLASLLAVQNTYLSTFQSLGGLGLLLGTVGLAVVQFRGAVERRGELALLRAGGFSRRRLLQLVLFEGGLLLIGGLAVGGLAAVVALAPHLAVGAARIPWLTLALLLAGIAVVGMIATRTAAVAILRMPIVPALRGE